MAQAKLQGKKITHREKREPTVRLARILAEMSPSEQKVLANTFHAMLTTKTRGDAGEMCRYSDIWILALAGQRKNERGEKLKEWIGAQLLFKPNKPTTTKLVKMAQYYFKIPPQMEPWLKKIIRRVQKKVWMAEWRGSQRSRKKKDPSELP